MGSQRGVCVAGGMMLLVAVFAAEWAGVVSSEINVAAAAAFGVEVFAVARGLPWLEVLSAALLVG